MKRLLIATLVLACGSAFGQTAKTGFLRIDEHGLEIIDGSGDLVGYCKGWVDSIKECKPSKGHTRTQMEAAYALIEQKTQAEFVAINPLTSLTCPAYQHIETGTFQCPHIGQGPSKDVCTESPYPKSYCADDMHEVTEREWQELIRRLRVMEHGRVKAKE